MDLTRIDFGKVFVWVLIWLVGYGSGLWEGWYKDRNRKAKVVEAPPKLIEENYSLAIFEEADQLQVKMDGTKLQSQAEMNPEQRKRLVDLVVRLRPWIDKRLANHPPPAQPISQTQNQPPVPKPIAPVERTTQPVQAAEIPETSEYRNLDMAGQINWILQRKLESHHLKSRGIRLASAINGGVEFYVDGQKYLSRDEIPSIEVREIIRISIAEWEKSSTPHL